MHTYLDYGQDHIRSYEFSCLNNYGKPVIYILNIYFQAGSLSLSPQSVKKYVNSFAGVHYRDKEHVYKQLQQFFQKQAKKVQILLTDINEVGILEENTNAIYNINHLLRYSNNQATAEILQVDPLMGKEQSLYIDQFLTNCESTMQPLLAKVWIHTRRCSLDVGIIAKYLSSYRDLYINQNQIAEHLFVDLNKALHDDGELVLQVNVERRGGLDTNFLRANKPGFTWISGDAGMFK